MQRGYAILCPYEKIRLLQSCCPSVSPLSIQFQILTSAVVMIRTHAMSLPTASTALAPMSASVKKASPVMASTAYVSAPQSAFAAQIRRARHQQRHQRVADKPDHS